MAEDNLKTAFGGTLNLLTLATGAKVRLTNGDIAEVVENPHDGMWLRCRYLSSESDPGIVGVEEQIFANDVAGVAE